MQGEMHPHFVVWGPGVYAHTSSQCSHVQVTMLLQRGEQQRRGHGDRAHEPARLVQIRDLEPVAEVPRKMSAG